MMLFSCLVVSANTFPPQDSSVWTNLTDAQADKLLQSKDQSYVFFFYRDTCLNSQSSISAILNYAEKNNMSLCGLNTTEYPSWMTWAKFLKAGQTSISFPFIVAYNADTKIAVAEDNVLTVKQFEGLLDKVGMLP